MRGMWLCGRGERAYSLRRMFAWGSGEWKKAVKSGVIMADFGGDILLENVRRLLSVAYAICLVNTMFIMRRAQFVWYSPWQSQVHENKGSLLDEGRGWQGPLGWVSLRRTSAWETGHVWVVIHPGVPVLQTSAIGLGPR